MAQQFTTTDGVTLILPGAYPSLKVQASVSGLSTTGVLLLVGEADAGPDYALEAELGDNAFGPDQLSDVLAKYKSGPLVDAFKVAAAPANDPDITGSPNRFILVKTNVSGKASAGLDKIGGGTYATLFDKSYGKLGNLTYFTVDEKTAEVKPTTSAFTYIPNVDTVDASARANGGAAQTLSLVANTQPPAFVTAVDALSDISASGGVDRGILTVAGTLAVAVPSANNITLTRSVAWAVTPTVGDTLIIPLGSVVAGGADQNVGAYVITARTGTTISATKLSDAGKPAAVAGTITTPVPVVATAILATTDASAWSPVTITLTATLVVDGLGKTLEINELGTGVDRLARTAYVLGTTTPTAWVSVSGSPKVLASAAEYAVTLNVNRQVDSVTEELSAGGQIALRLGYEGTTASVVVTATTMVFTVTGGSGSNLSIALKDFPTLADLASYINSRPGYQAVVGSAAVGSFSSMGLDEGTFTAGTTWGNYTLRLKIDAVKFYQLVSGNSALVQLGNPPAPATAGLPATMASTTYLSGGTRGGTTDAAYDAAIDALENVKGNFLVPLFSRDAALDVIDDLTDSGSTYTIANVHAYAKTHALKMSTLKRRKNRQAVLGIRDTFANAKDEAQNLASYRVALAFQDVKAVGANGIVQYQPHMLAALAAGMQGAGFYKAIVHKGINCSGILQAAGDFKDSSDSNVEDALLAGLLPAKKSDDGGFIWVSDQTTYSKDDNFVFNSLQAVYVADTIALTCAQRMEKAFVGQSVADVSAAVALAALEAIMADFLRLKLISVSDDAPKGFKDASIKISGTTMIVQVSIRLSGTIYFIPINFLVSQVIQVAA